MTHRKLASALGITCGQVCKLAQRGMPTDCPEAAREWRARNIAPWARVSSLAPSRTENTVDRACAFFDGMTLEQVEAESDRLAAELAGDVATVATAKTLGCIRKYRL